MLPIQAVDSPIFVHLKPSRRSIKPDVATVVRPNIAALEINPKSQQIAAGGIGVMNAIKKEAVIESPFTARARIRKHG